MKYQEDIHHYLGIHLAKVKYSFLFNRDKKFKTAGKGQSIWCEGSYGWWSYHFGFQSSMSKLIKIGSISTYEDTQNLIKNDGEYNVKEV